MKQKRGKTGIQRVVPIKALLKDELPEWYMDGYPHVYAPTWLARTNPGLAEENEYMDGYPRIYAPTFDSGRWVELNAGTHHNKNQEGEIMKKFKPGQKLSTRSIGDYDCIFNGEVIKRTAKTVTINAMYGVKRCKVHTDDQGDEYIYPFSRYSMAPIFRP